MPRYFFNNTIRSYDIAVGKLFNDIWFQRYNRETNEIIEEIRVPLVYAPKLHWYLRKYDTLPKDYNIKTTLPRISFSRGAPVYDTKRQINKYVEIKGIKKFSEATQNYIQKWVGSSVPYRFPYAFNIWAKNENDMNQILEQILANFNTQSFNVFVYEVPLLGVGRNCRIVLENATQNYQSEFDIKGDRLLRYSFNLHLEGNMYPAISQQSVVEEIIAQYRDAEASENQILETVRITEESINE